MKIKKRNLEKRRLQNVERFLHKNIFFSYKVQMVKLARLTWIKYSTMTFNPDKQMSILRPLMTLVSC